MLFLYHLLIDEPNDCAKFDKIAMDYSNIMYRVAYRIVKDRYYANEALQSALTSIARNIGHIEIDNEFMLKSYLCTVAENAGIDIWRRRKRDRKVLSFDDCTEIPADDNVFKNVAGKEQENRLAALLYEMPMHYREVIVLSILHGHSLYQIADELDRNYCTVRKQLERGKKMLKELIKEAGICD